MTQLSTWLREEPHLLVLRHRNRATHARRALFEDSVLGGELRNSCGLLPTTGCRWLFLQLPSTCLPQALCTCYSPLSGTCFFHILTWFIPSLPLGFFLNVVLSRETIPHKIAIPCPRGQHPLPLTVLHCFHHHPTHLALTYVFIARLPPLGYVLHKGRDLVHCSIPRY